MVQQRFFSIRRALAALGAATTIAMSGFAMPAAAAEQTFDITGTVYAVNGHLLTIVTSDVIGKPQAITVDVSYLPDLQIATGAPIQLTIRSRESDSYLAIGIVRESPFVNGADFGVQERFEVRNDSIQAGVGNVPDDDEALAQQHRTSDLHQRDNGKHEDNNTNRKHDK
ncbi:MAG: hypothetical protein IT305_09445 [Chloroflexi bacterium]|nr:hypothetical protein [Chloroflexota bacterium]